MLNDEYIRIHITHIIHTEFLIILNSQLLFIILYIDVEVNFVPTSYTHSETDGFATLTAVASGVCDYNYSLLVNTSDGTAKCQYKCI